MRPECEKVEILRGRSLAYREPNLNRRQQWQHLEPLAAGLEAAGLFRSDIRQVDAVGTLRAEARGREARQLVFLGYRLQFHSLFSFHNPPPPTPRAPLCLKRVKRKFWSKVKNEGKIYEYTQAWDQKLHSQLQWKSRQGKVKKKNFPHLKNKKKLLGRWGSLVCLLSQVCQHLWISYNLWGLCWLTSTTRKCQDPHNPRTKSSNVSNSLYFISFIAEVCSWKNHKKNLGLVSWLLFLYLTQVFSVRSSKERIIEWVTFSFFRTLTFFIIF